METQLSVALLALSAALEARAAGQTATATFSTTAVLEARDHTTAAQEISAAKQMAAEEAARTMTKTLAANAETLKWTADGAAMALAALLPAVQRAPRLAHAQTPHQNAEALAVPATLLKVAPAPRAQTQQKPAPEERAAPQ